MRRLSLPVGVAMGSRGRSIRLRIYFLVAIPVVTMLGLLAYVVSTTVNNAINLDRAPSLINATSLPTADFVNKLQAERLAAVVYVFAPTAANLQAYQAAIKQTDAAKPAFVAALQSPATQSSATPAIRQGIAATLASLSQLSQLRQGVMARLLAPGKPMTALDALGAYSVGIQNEPRLFLAESESMTNATAASQSLALIATVSAREALSEEDALLAGMLAAGKESQADRSAFAELASTRAGDTVDAQSLFDPANAAIYNAVLRGTAAAQQQVNQIEQAIEAGVPVTRLRITPAQWEQLTSTLLTAHFNAGVSDVKAQLDVDHQITHAAWVRVTVASSVGAAGFLLTILLTTLLGGSIIRRLRGLETSALTLAEKQLPDVIGRLRRGEEVDVAGEAPPLRIGRDEIGRVGQAFDLVRQTAIRSAVEEAKLRRGLNDMFRSLARRSQSLLHRQLTLLDQMERRATDPEALDDLFRLDHLTTRMRRHAEGLVILAGAPAGRGWSSPVRMLDVMRGAIAEVEDYARVSVVTRSQAALSGAAVADVIHLLAELIENATTLSPPYTSVRVSGDIVANGFAIEVEDRGLGMSEHRLAELNERLANPPQFNPSEGEQLGLFVVSQLARRHGIRVTLKPSPYGGTEAVVLIPRNLVVIEEAFRASLPGTPVTGGQLATAQDLTPQTLPPDVGTAADLGTSPDFAGGPRISGPLRRANGGSHGQPRGSHHAPRPGGNNGIGGSRSGTNHGNGFGTSGPLPTFPRVPDAVEPNAIYSPEPQLGRVQQGQGQQTQWRQGQQDRLDVFGVQEGGTLPRRTRGTASPSTAEPFDVFRPKQGEGVSRPYQDPPAATPDPLATPMIPVASGTARVSRPPWELEEDELAAATPPAPDQERPDGASRPDDDFKGLPRRVRQASLAPQLRADPAPGSKRAGTAPDGTATGGTAGVAPGPSPEEIRATMSALQRGWQEGRSQRTADEEPAVRGEPEGDSDAP